MAKYVVRVVLFEHQSVPIVRGLIECFRYAGLVCHPLVGMGHPLTFDIYPPHEASTSSKAWADMNAERMRSFGFNAEAAPPAS